MLPRLRRAAIPTACGLLGAIIMPHNLFLHSALVHSRGAAGSAGAPGASSASTGGAGAGARAADALARRDSAVYYNVDSGLALAVALFINTAVISVFARGFHGEPGAERIGLENAGEYLGRRFGAHMKVGAL